MEGYVYYIPKLNIFWVARDFHPKLKGVTFLTKNKKIITYKVVPIGGI